MENSDQRKCRTAFAQDTGLLGPLRVCLKLTKMTNPFCHQCGAEVSDTKFCSSCGANLKPGASESDAPQNGPANETHPKPGGEQTIPSAGAQPSDGIFERWTNASLGGKAWMAIVAVCLVGVAVQIVGAISGGGFEGKVSDYNEGQEVKDCAGTGVSTFDEEAGEDVEIFRCAVQIGDDKDYYFAPQCYSEITDDNAPEGIQSIECPTTGYRPMVGV